MKCLLTALGAASLAVCALALAGGCHFSTQLGWDFDGSFRETALRTESHALALDTGQRLRVDAAYGEVEVTAEEGEPGLEATFRARANTQAKAAEMLEKTSLSIESDAQGACVRVSDDPVDQGQGDIRIVVRTEVALRIHVPIGTRLEIEARSKD